MNYKQLATILSATILGAASLPLWSGAQTITAAMPTQRCSVQSMPVNLYLGVSNSYVIALQDYLKAEGYFSFSSTGYYGPITARAVIVMQRAAGLPPTGYFGPLSRGWLARHCGDTGDQTGKSRIYSLTPKSGPVGTQVTIDGFGFNSDNTIHFGSGVIVHVASSGGIGIACTTDPNCRGGIHQSLTFTVPSSLEAACRFSATPCMIVSRQTTPGSYDVWVENSNGSSSHATFVVTAAGANNPSINTISPSSGPIGTTVTLQGSGFSSSDVIIIGDGSIRGASASPSGSSLSFTIPSSVGPYCAPNMMCAMYMKVLSAGAYQVYVKDESTGVDSNKVTFTVTANGGGQGVSVSGIDAPTTLPIGSSGTWTVHALSNSANTSLHYSVVWGDEANAGSQAIMAPPPSNVGTSASFTHTYHLSGTYTPTFTVSDDQGHSASASATIIVTPLY
jgi:peptidoglycan hydrolase-like protein with peptidoglycan-binding domain